MINSKKILEKWQYNRTKIHCKPEKNTNVKRKEEKMYMLSSRSLRRNDRSD